jgi:hypothetical protein
MRRTGEQANGVKREIRGMAVDGVVPVDVPHAREFGRVEVVRLRGAKDSGSWRQCL